jgi:hypothetical protein
VVMMYLSNSAIDLSHIDEFTEAGVSLEMAPEKLADFEGVGAESLRLCL